MSAHIPDASASLSLGGGRKLLKQSFAIQSALLDAASSGDADALNLAEWAFEMEMHEESLTEMALEMEMHAEGLRNRRQGSCANM